ncbi:putative transporter protein [Oceanicaulis alexandrii HTCC2633]|uniref:zinc transporter ZntB n=1 Tax=Oceanicaulis sp. HTCC2633 TaxID=314254 RepID=UPI0000668B0E|nr:zinc transporter ZntB [Oceanicaulis sp. HTCC2633]EAP90573.1 putative transporter protein [Oceanicaulis alexandrii HTCC2633] [Oceanicaulis sp. HTCC2633]
MTPTPIYAFDVMAGGATRPVEDLGAPAGREVVYRWVHLDRSAEGVTAWIEAQADAVVASALAREDTRPRVAEHADGLILIMRGVNLNPNSDPEDMVSIRLWVSDRLVISTRMRRLMAVAEIADGFRAGQGPATASDFICALAQGLTARMEPVLDELVDEIDDLEERSVDQASGLRGQLAEVRRTTIALRRYLAPQRDVLARLSVEDIGPLRVPDVRVSLRETADQLTRLVEELDMVRDRSSILNDQMVDARAEEMNSAMLLLSVVAAVFLPLGFLTGLLGINVGGLPGANWPYAFALVCALCLGVAGGLIWWFRKKGWL